MLQVSVTLTFDQQIPKSVGIIYVLSPIKTHIMMSLSFVCFKFLNG